MLYHKQLNRAILALTGSATELCITIHYPAVLSLQLLPIIASNSNSERPKSSESIIDGGTWL
jgi:hypothetical protein